MTDAGIVRAFVDEIDALRAENGKLHQQRIRLFDERDKLVVENEELRRESQFKHETALQMHDRQVALLEQRDQENERLRAVVEAARFADNCIDDDDPVSTHNNGPGSCLWDLHKALATFDQT